MYLRVVYTRKEEYLGVYLRVVYIPGVIPRGVPQGGVYTRDVPRGVPQVVYIPRFIPRVYLRVVYIPGYTLGCTSGCVRWCIYPRVYLRVCTVVYMPPFLLG